MKRTIALCTGALSAVALILSACSAGHGSSLDDEETTEAPPTPDDTDFESGDGGGDTSQGTLCDNNPALDQDNDGWTGAEGDCSDCDPNVNPGAIEVATDPNDPNAIEVDENCNGEIDEPAYQACDDGLILAEPDPMRAAQAIDLCKTADANGKDWGVIYAHFVRANGDVMTITPNIGMLSNFGPNVQPRDGSRMLGLSSGAARTEADPDNCEGDYSCSFVGAGQAPPGFPQDVPGCMGGGDINDDVGLEVRLRAPTNATGYSYDFTFYSFEYPEWVCTTFNDQYIALVNPAPQGSINGNISFDAQNNPVSVNIAFFDICPGCAQGVAEMEGTGFNNWNDAGATGWLQTQAPVEGGSEFNIRFAIWDTGDTAFDSTVIIDNFKWIADGGSVAVGTLPVPR